MALTNLGILLVDEGKIDDGIALLKRALDENPRLDEALYHIAKAHRLQGNPEKALPYIQYAYELNPDEANERSLKVIRMALGMSPVLGDSRSLGAYYRSLTGE